VGYIIDLYKSAILRIFNLVYSGLRKILDNEHPVQFLMIYFEGLVISRDN